ncbi:hypothetical protein NJC40_03425 [Pseudomonas sp. 21LCFQ02]|uniref:hypothetical protein n=1 Tax=Pseudomonas sp. 21LCFQ02 TaxID=2957505 RepID=UPI00209B4879|nr:hypothetical protein [Pseudomonas sp. 21LCFQ02]MCO8166828.1 hypothetical protein [Pseudomonas sp. 21LCFQ02]
MKQIFLAVMAMGLVGCSGHVVTYQGERQACKDGKCEGIPFRKVEPAIAQRTLNTIPASADSKARYSNKTGDEGCVEVLDVTIVNAASKDVSYISYQPGLFEYAEFSVDLNPNGTLSKVGVVPVAGLKEAAESVASIASAYKLVNEANALSVKSAGLPKCTHVNS